MWAWPSISMAVLWLSACTAPILPGDKACWDRFVYRYWTMVIVDGWLLDVCNVGWLFGWFGGFLVRWWKFSLDWLSRWRQEVGQLDVTCWIVWQCYVWVFSLNGRWLDIVMAGWLHIVSLSWSEWVSAVLMCFSMLALVLQYLLMGAEAHFHMHHPAVIHQWQSAGWHLRPAHLSSHCQSISYGGNSALPSLVICLIEF